MSRKSILTKSIIHSLEVAVTCLVVLGVLYLASLIGLVDVGMIRDAVLPMLLASLATMIPKAARSSDSVPIKDYVNE